MPVIRGSLNETLLVDGLITAETQEPVLYAWRGLVDDIKVKVGQAVKQGDILVEFSPGDAPKNLETARARLQTSLGNLALAQAQAQSSQAAIAQRIAADQQKQQQAILDAEIALRRAQDNLVTVKAGRSATERQVAATSVSYYGETTVALAQSALDAALAGPDETTVKNAQRDVANAQLAVNKARADLDVLTRGPDPATLRTAEAAVQRAQSQLQLAQVTKIDPKAPDPAVAKIQHETAIQDAQNALDNAEAQVAKLKQPPADLDVQSAKARLLDVQTNLSNSQAKLDALQAGPDQAAVDAAQQKLEYAKHTLAEMQLGLDEVNSHPTPGELQAAQDQVRGAQAALEGARQAVPNADDSGPDLSALQKVISQDQADVSTAELALEYTHLRAPFDGVVVSIRTKAGDATVPSKPVVIMTRQAVPIVRVDLDDTQVGRVAAGQRATVQVGDGGSTVTATVTRVTPAAPNTNAGAFATLGASWPDGDLPRFGTHVQVTLGLGGKQGVLVVPKSAVHQAGGRTTVEVQDGTLRRLVSVQIGISTSDGVEIVSGLTEGQMVLAGPA